jgi:hypothetical protein
MSDFGTVIIAKPANSSLGKSTVDEIMSLIVEEIESGDYSSLFSENMNDFETFTRGKELVVILYDLYDGLEDEDIEFAKEETMPDAERIATELNSQYGEDYVFSASWEEW